MRSATSRAGPARQPFRKVASPKRLRLSDAIAEQIEQLIVDGDLPPGAPLPSERDLAERLSVSRPSLREALLKMEARGLIQVRRGGGFAVTDVTAPTVAEPLAHLLNHHPKAAEDVLELRHGLEAVAAFFAALRATDEDLKAIEAAFARLARKQQERDALADADSDAEFHMAIAEASHNTALVHVTRGIFNLLRANIQRTHAVLYGNAATLEALIGQHKAILDAIRARNPEVARRAAHTHLDFVQTTLRTGRGRA